MSKSTVEITSRSVEETISLGEALAGGLSGGELIALIGELGTGKTHLIKGVARGLAEAVGDEGDNAAGAVTSPTFTLMNEYEGRVPMVHIDAYRLENAGQLVALGFDEMVGESAVVMVEWADRVESLVLQYEPIVIRLQHRGATERLIRLEIPDRYDSVRQSLRQVG